MRPIEKRQLGRSGLEVAVVGMGTWKTFDVAGSKVERDRARLVSLATEYGMNLFDSSPMYGKAERVLGQALAPIRDSVLVATKVWSNDDRVAATQIDESLSHFGGHVDVYQVHNLVSAPTRLQTLQDLRAAGHVRAVGITHWSEDAYEQMSRYLDLVDAIQIPYNPQQNKAGEKLLNEAAERAIGVLVMRPFGEGSLLRQSPGSNALAQLADFGVTTWPQALLKWVLSDPRCHVAIPATSAPRHLLENLAAGSPPWFGPKERDFVADLAR